MTLNEMRIVEQYENRKEYELKRFVFSCYLHSELGSRIFVVFDLIYMGQCMVDYIY